MQKINPISGQNITILTVSVKYSLLIKLSLYKITKITKNEFTHPIVVSKLHDFLSPVEKNTSVRNFTIWSKITEHFIILKKWMTK